jgi:hypothetical protein
MKRKPRTARAKLIPAADYPALLPPARRLGAMRLLASDELRDKAEVVISMNQAELLGAVLEDVERLGPAARAKDWATMFQLAHEIRGLAATAGLGVTGHIANGLCRYLDTLARWGVEADVGVASLHLDAIVRSARTEDDAARHGATVVDQLASLVNRKLGEIKETTML